MRSRLACLSATKCYNGFYYLGPARGVKESGLCEVATILYKFVRFALPYDNVNQGLDSISYHLSLISIRSLRQQRLNYP